MSDRRKQTKITKKRALTNAVTKEGDGPRRRGFLRGTGGIMATLASIPGISSVVRAEGKPDYSELAATVEEYNNPQAASTAFWRAGSALLEHLINNDIIREEEVQDLTVDEILPHRDSSRVDEGVIVLSYVAGNTPTAQIQVIKQLQNYRLRIAVEPQANRSFALLEPNDDDMKGIKVYSDDSGVGTQDFCQTDWYGNCNHDPSQTDCTEDNPCGCYQTEVECCQERECAILGYRNGDCFASPEGCTVHNDCTYYCS